MTQRLKTQTIAEGGHEFLLMLQGLCNEFRLNRRVNTTNTTQKIAMRQCKKGEYINTVVEKNT